MFSPSVVNCFSCASLMRFEGYRITTRIPGTLKNPCATALPVSPEVATNTVNCRSSPRTKYPISRAMNRAPKSLNASVGPWNSSRMCSPGDSETIFTGKLIASLTICHNNSSGTSGVANGFTTRKQTSVNGSARNSSSSSGERRAISAGIYNPPSGASPRNTAPRSEVSGALRDVLRYLNEFYSSRVSRFALNHFQERGGIQRSIAQRGDLQRAMRERFITLAPRGNQSRITTRHCFPRPFSRLWLKRAAPQHRLRIVQISFDQELLLLRASR